MAMTHIDVVEQSLRDGQQSLWGMRMRAYEAADALPYLARGGYRTIDLTGAGMFTVLLREYFEDPWATLDFLVAGLRVCAPSARLVSRIRRRSFSICGFRH